MKEPSAYDNHKRPRRRDHNERRKRKLRVMSEPPTYRDKTLHRSKSGHHLRKAAERIKPLRKTEVSTKLPLENRMALMNLNGEAAVSWGKRVSIISVKGETMAAVPWAEITARGLFAVLRSKVPLAYFLHSCIQDMSFENLLCYLEICRFEAESYSNLEQRREAANRIRNQFIAPCTYFELNIEARLKKSLEDKMKSSDQIGSCFAEIKATAAKNMADSWRRFKQTDIYNCELKQMGEDNRLDEFESRVQASEKLLNLLKAERSRDRILFKMLSPYIFRFITHTLSIEVDEKTLSTINPLGIKGGLEAIQCKEILYKNGESVARFFTPL